MSSNREEMGEFKQAIKEFFATTQPLMQSTEKKVIACKACLDSIGGKVNDLELRVIAMEERQERQEIILQDHLIQQEMMRCKLEELASQFESSRIAIGSSLDGS